MADLHPTPARLLLLRDVANGHVRDDADSTPMLHYDDEGTPGATRVAEAIWLMRQAGWVELPPGTDEPAELDTWRLTDTGRAVVLGAGLP
jgi:hypothetical protein